MKVSISNLAWNPAFDGQTVDLLKKYQISGIDLAPTKIWTDPVSISRGDILNYRKFWTDKDIQIIGIQSLLFGHPELEIFKDQKSRDDTLEYLRKISKLSHQLGAKVLVFGSPKNRQVGSLKKIIINKIVTEFFSKISDICQSFNLVFCLEPNPVQYDCDFITNHLEAIELVKMINHPAFRINLDTSTMTLNAEDYSKTIASALPWSGHLHISEPDLVPIGSKSTDHVKIASILSSLNYEGWISIEMKEQSGDTLSVLKKSIKYVKKTYK